MIVQHSLLKVIALENADLLLIVYMSLHVTFILIKLSTYSGQGTVERVDLTTYHLHL